MYEELIEYYKTHKTSPLTRQHPEFATFLEQRTHFLNPAVTTTQRLWHFWNNCFSVPKCKHCTNLVKWDIVNQTYRPFCSQRCGAQYNASNAPVTIKPPRPICLAPGCNKLTNWTSNDGGKWRNTCSPECSKAYQASLVVTEDEMFNVIRQLPIDYQYIKFVSDYRAVFNTIQQFTSHLPSSYQIKERIQWLLGDTKTRKEIFNEKLEGLGVDDASSIMEARAKLRGSRQCKVCGKDRVYDVQSKRYPKYCSDDCKTAFKRNQALVKLHRVLKRELTRRGGNLPHNTCLDWRLNDPNWLIHHHYMLKWTKQQIARELNVDKETISNRFKQFGLTSIRHACNAAENDIVNYIQTLVGPEVEIKTNDRTIINPKELDVYIPSMNIAIEYCGLYWHSDIHDRIDRNYHKNKMVACADKGIRLITIFEDEWLHKRDIVTKKLANILNKSSEPIIYARQTVVTDCSVNERMVFLNQHHIQGDGSGSINLALRSNDDIVSVMTFKNRGGGSWELTRFASSCRVIGGFSKLIAHFKRTINPAKIISFADLRWSTGQSYAQVGFIHAHTLPPDYSYINSSNTTRMHKFNFRRKTLTTKLKDFDPTLSETANMKKHNILKIWDCGKIRYEMQ